MKWKKDNKMPNSKSGKIGASAAAVGILSGSGGCDLPKMSGVVVPASNGEDSSMEDYVDDDDEEDDDEEFGSGSNDCIGMYAQNYNNNKINMENTEMTLKNNTSEVNDNSVNGNESGLEKNSSLLSVDTSNYYENAVHLNNSSKNNYEEMCFPNKIINYT